MTIRRDVGREAGHASSDWLEYVGEKEGWKLFFILIECYWSVSCVCWLKIADVVWTIFVPVISV
jgi:hypothetical protein